MQYSVNLGSVSKQVLDDCGVLSCVQLSFMHNADPSLIST